jgi:hypothetical protein
MQQLLYDQTFSDEPNEFVIYRAGREDKGVGSRDKGRRKKRGFNTSPLAIQWI